MKPGARLVLASAHRPYGSAFLRLGIEREPALLGPAASLVTMMKRTGGIWIAPGDDHEPPQRTYLLGSEFRYLPAATIQLRGLVDGFSSHALWPLCHYFLGRVQYDLEDWQAYDDLNSQFAQAILNEAGEGDTLWVQDFHLARVPYFIRERRPPARILFFWHIPFPSVEVFRTLPWRRPVLEGLLACDLVGFQIPEYVNNFLACAVEILGASVVGDSICWAGHTSRALARPMGIDFGAIDREARLPKTIERVQQLQYALANHPVVMGVELMDYTQGILERLRAVEKLLDQTPSLRGNFILIQLVIPPEVADEANRQKKQEIDEIVGRVNGRFSDGIWSPVHCQYGSLSRAELIAYFGIADVVLITPLRAGLGLVAKEYVASRIAEDGVLIVSEFAGVAQQLPEALITNPYSCEELAASIYRALYMSKVEQQQRMSTMRGRVKAQDIHWWAAEFLNYDAVEA